MYSTMKNESHKSLDRLWGNLLSRQPVLIREAFEGLSPSEQQSILDHLRKMAQEAGWQPEQRLSAQAALNVLLSSRLS
jgi:hypothetical protein